MFKRIAILAALAAGTVALTACGPTESASGSERGGPAEVNVDLATGEGEQDPVNCGEVEVHGSSQNLIAVRANGGIVGCTEAFNILDEFLTRGTGVEAATLSDGWSCAIDDGEIMTVACVKGDAQDPAGLGFHTRAAETGEALEPVNCGEINVDGTKHTLTAEPAEDGLVGCTEAFNVIGEYLAIPQSKRGADLDGTDLASGWSCVIDDGEIAGIGCVKGRTGDSFGFAFSTTPV